MLIAIRAQRNSDGINVVSVVATIPNSSAVTGSLKLFSKSTIVFNFLTVVSGKQRRSLLEF